ncbi:transposase [Streptomyces sp. NPDC006992]|uniref:transposase n=1 Tax=Streptomyces sp. NPDC006992 TaxID=3155601 RepID=UPI0033DCDA74
MDGPVKTLVGVALAPEHRRGHVALYGGLNRGRVEASRLRRVLASVPRAVDGRLVLAVDVSPWLRPDAATSDARSFCHTYGWGENKHLMIPGWPCSWIVALETGRSSWTAPLDAVRLRPGDDLAAVTAAQVQDLVERLITAGQWNEGEPPIWIVLDAGYDVMRLAWLLSDLSVELLGHLRSDRVMRRRAPSREEYYRAHPRGGHPPRHGGESIFKIARNWGAPRGDEDRRDEDRHHPLRHRPRPELGPAPPRTAIACRLAGPPRQAPRHRGHRNPPPGRPPAQWRRPQAPVAVVVTAHSHPRGDGPGLAGVPQKIRHRALLQNDQAL